MHNITMHFNGLIIKVLTSLFLYTLYMAISRYISIYLYTRCWQDTYIVDARHISNKESKPIYFIILMAQQAHR